MDENCHAVLAEKVVFVSLKAMWWNYRVMRRIKKRKTAKEDVALKEIDNAPMYQAIPHSLACERKLSMYLSYTSDVSNLPQLPALKFLDRLL